MTEGGFVLGRILREHWMLVAAAILAIASMALVPPDDEYLSYVDWDTVGCLFCVLGVGNSLRRAGAFDRIARSAIGHIRSTRAMVFDIVMVTALFSVLFTNVVALIIMLPLSATMLVRLGSPLLVPRAFALQALAANLCGMIAPFGSPQNIFIYTRYQLRIAEFLGTMALPVALSLAGILFATWLLTGRQPSGDAHDGTGSASAGRSSARDLSQSIAPAMGSVRVAIYIVLFLASLLAIFRMVPVPAAVLLVAGVMIAIDRPALRTLDYSLLATFLCFFVFAGNISRMPALGEMLGPLMDQWGLLVSALVSQVISNVPAAVILSHFTEVWQPLLVGVNIGGAGTFVGSLASLIAIRYYDLVRKEFAPWRSSDAPGMGGFLLVFGSLNMAFFIGLLAVLSLAPLW